MDALSGDTAAARLEYIVRDHDREKFEARKELLRGVEKAMTEKYPTARGGACAQGQLLQHAGADPSCMHLIDNAKKACEAAGVQWFEEATRGGTGRCAAVVYGFALSEPGNRGP